MTTAPLPRPIAERELRVGELETPVRIRIYAQPDGAFLAIPSHYIKTAIQYLPDSAAHSYHCELDEVAGKVLAGMMHFYDQAVRRGYQPGPEWLVLNGTFDAALHASA